MGVEELSLDNILSGEEIENLFIDEETPVEETEETKDKDKELTTEVINVEELFTEEEPESVGSEEEHQEEGEGTKSEKDKGTSPKTNFYSSTAKAFKEEGIFPDLDDETIEGIAEPEDLAKAVNDVIESRLTEVQKRVNDALTVGVEPTAIKYYEDTLGYLNSIKETHLLDESDKGEKIRKTLILQDAINRGYSQERAQREVQKSFDAGTDIEDAKEALTSNRKFFSDQYQGVIDEHKEIEENDIKETKAQAEKLKKSILEGNDILGGLSIDKNTRQRIYDNLSKPVYKDPETGNMYTAIQKYELENKTELLKNIGILYTLTDGFKNLDNLVKTKVKKEVKKGLRELEHTINNTSRASDGSLKFASGVADDPESFIGKGWTLDV